VEQRVGAVGKSEIQKMIGAHVDAKVDAQVPVK
jgi:hypothetical protein